MRLPGRATPLGLRLANLQPATHAVALEPEPAGGGAVGGGTLWQPLYNAVVEEDEPAVRRLLAAGADPNVGVCKPLVIAAQYGRLEAARLLLDAGAEPSLAGEDGFTPLMTAAAYGHPEVVRLLLDGGADPSLAAGDGFTPVMAAAICGRLEVLRLLLVRGAAVDTADPYRGQTAFHSTCARNQAECAEALVRAGCDVGLKDKSGHTGREMAEAQQGGKEVVRRLRALARQPFVGVLVELAGLVGAAEHNGKRATVRCHNISCSLLHSFFLHSPRCPRSKNHSCAWRLNGMKWN